MGFRNFLSRLVVFGGRQSKSGARNRSLNNTCFSSFFFTAESIRDTIQRMTNTKQFTVIEEDQELARFNERLRQLRALSSDQRIKRILAWLRELCHAKQQQDAARN
jgi:hypothetical protein